MALRLHEPAHNAKDRVERVCAGVGEKRGNDGVVGALGGRETVRVCSGEDEAGTAVLEGEAAGLGDYGGAETAEV